MRTVDKQPSIHIHSPSGTTAFGIAAMSIVAMLAACRPAFSESDAAVEAKPGSERTIPVVEAVVDGITYRVPANYYTPTGTIERNKNATGISVVAFLPNLRGLKPTERRLAIYENKVTIHIKPQDAGGVSPEQSLSNRQFTGAKRKGFVDKLELLEFEDIDGSSLFLGEAIHGQKILLDCSSGQPNDLCSIEYFHEQNGYWLFYYYNKKYLSSWKKIDEDINTLILSWRADSVSDQ